MQELTSFVHSHFEQRFSKAPLMVASPGRINLIGEHTDYNLGYVFPAAINRYIVCALAPNELDHCRVMAIDLDEEFEFRLEDINRQSSGSWKNYVAGVVAGMIGRGARLQNFDLAFAGNIPIGAGLSSSAALENGIAFGLNELFGLGFDKNEILNISVEAEHRFAGVECGMMDQFANLHGKAGHALYLDCADMSCEAVPLELHGHQLLLINTNVQHELSDSPYNARKESCRSGLRALQKLHPELPSLSAASMDQLDGIKTYIPQETYHRCRFVIEENERVHAAKVALANKDMASLGELLFASHYGLRDLYEVSCPELDLLVELAEKHEGALGARMMGGGFGGCTLNLVQEDAADDLVQTIMEDYNKRTGKTANALFVNLVDGTHAFEV